MWQFTKKILQTGIKSESISLTKEPGIERIGQELKRVIAKRFGKSLAIRVVDAGSCNACELEINATTNPFYNLKRFGIHFVASPRHADMLLVTGPVTRNMADALKKTYDAMPDPKLVVAIGDCALCGGVFKNSYAIQGNVNSIIPVDVVVPGCPPTPAQIIQGIFIAINKNHSET